jgi:hypothetical protein
MNSFNIMHEKHHNLLNQPKYPNPQPPIYPPPQMYPPPIDPAIYNNPYSYNNPYNNPYYPYYPDPYSQQIEENQNSLHELEKLKKTFRKDEPTQTPYTPQKKSVNKYNVLKHLIDTVDKVNERVSGTAIKKEPVGDGVSEKYKLDYYNDIYKPTQVKKDNSAILKTLFNDTSINGFKIDDLILTSKKKF